MMNVARFYPLFFKAAGVTIDSRAIKPNEIFFAFSGENYNAAIYAEKAVDEGAAAVIVEQREFENAHRHIFYVPSTLEFLQQLATFHREQLKVPVIGLTGSNGKTTTKELIHAVLNKKFNVQYTRGNLNNHIGVPLTLLSIRHEHEIAVVEMGANHQKEIELLCNIAKPNIGYITNFGKAHLEGFGGFEGVIKGKSEMYDFLRRNNQTILVNDNDSIQVEKTEDYKPKITFGSSDSAYNFEMITGGNFVGLNYKGQRAQSRLTGSYNFTNLCAAASLGLHFNIPFSRVKSAIEQYEPTNMRSQILEKNGKTLVLDTYNANPSSMTESLRNFSAFEGSKTVIIGDMLELGEESEAEHIAILNIAYALNFDEIITVGEFFKKINVGGKSYVNVKELSSAVQADRILSKNVLLKASRGIALESVLQFID